MVVKNLLALNFFPFLLTFWSVFKTTKFFLLQAGEKNTNFEIVMNLEKNRCFCRFFFCGFIVTPLRENVLVFRCCCLCTAVKVTSLTEITVLALSLAKPLKINAGQNMDCSFY